MTRTGDLINGRGEHLVSVATLKAHNANFVNGDGNENGNDGNGNGNENDTITFQNKRVKGMKTVPFNEVFLRVGHGHGHGHGRNGNPKPSFLTGLGHPIALFTRGNTYHHLVELLRAREELATRMRIHMRMRMRTTTNTNTTRMGRNTTNTTSNATSNTTTNTNTNPLPILLLDPLTGSTILHSELLQTLHSHLSTRVSPFGRGALGVSVGWGDDSNDNVSALNYAVRAGNTPAARKLLIGHYFTFKRATFVPPGLRAATTNGELLAVLGGWTIIYSLQSGENENENENGGGRERLNEAASCLEEWCATGAKKGVKFRLKEWRKQRRRSSAMAKESARLGAFLSNEAVEKRSKFANDLRGVFANSNSNLESKSQGEGEGEVEAILNSLSLLVNAMNKPCLRLEILLFGFELEPIFTLPLLQASLTFALTIVNGAS